MLLTHRVSAVNLTLRKIRFGELKLLGFMQKGVCSAQKISPRRTRVSTRQLSRTPFLGMVFRIARYINR